MKIICTVCKKKYKSYISDNDNDEKSWVCLNCYKAVEKELKKFKQKEALNTMFGELPFGIVL